MQNNFPKDLSKYKLIVSDFDGTLAGADHLISQKVKDAVKRWIDSGRHFSIASGRQHLMIAQDAKELGLRSPIIVRGGAEIVSYDGKVIFSKEIEKEEVRGLVEIMVANKYGVMVEIGNTIYSNFTYYGAELYEDLIIKPLESLPFSSAPKLNVRVHVDKVKQTEEFMNNTVIPKFKTLHFVRSYNILGLSYDITSLMATKNIAVLELIKHLGLTREQTVGVGDGYNDFSLLEAAGLKVAMGNANDELKAIADVIVPSLEDDGVAYLIDKLLE